MTIVSIFAAWLLTAALFGDNLIQCQNQAIRGSRFFSTRPGPNNLQLWVAMPEGSRHLIARLECFDCELNNGYYRSEDGGGSWVHLQDYKPEIPDSPISFGTHPANRNIIYRTVAEGQGVGKQWFLEKSGDGTKTWHRCTAFWKEMGSSIRWFADIRYHPIDPNTLYATAPVPTEIRKCRFLFVSKDGGETFSFLLDDAYDVDLCRSKPDVMYAVGFSNQVQKSSDGGHTWELVGQTDDIRQKYTSIDGTKRANEVFAVRIDPNKCDTVYLLSSVGVLQSMDGGVTWCVLDLAGGQRYTPCSIAIDPINTRVVFVGTTDRGLFKSEDGGCTWKTIDIAKRIQK